jgi:hypothetical protein
LAKGGLVAGSGANTTAVLSVGTDGTTLVANSANATGLGWAGNQAGGKNALINGNFDVWARGISSTASFAYATADRWFQYIGSGSGTFSQESTIIPTGSRYCMKFTSSAIGTSSSISQYMETYTAIPYANKSITISSLVASSTSLPVTYEVDYSTTVDAGTGASWTTITPTSGGTATPTSTTFVSLLGTYAIPSTAKSIRVIISTGTMANGVVVYFGQIQFELGSNPTTFTRAGGTFQGELAACQRYFQTIGAYQTSGNLYSTTACAFVTSLPVVMRTTPTATYNTTYTNAVDVTGVANRTPTVYGIYGSSASSFAFLAQGFALATIYAPATYIGGNHQLSAEL